MLVFMGNVTPFPRSFSLVTIDSANGLLCRYECTHGHLGKPISAFRCTDNGKIESWVGSIQDVIEEWRSDPVPFRGEQVKQPA